MDDRSNSRLVDIEITGADSGFPSGNLAVVETLQSAGQAIARRIHEIDRFVEGFKSHHTEQGAKEFRAMREAIRLHSPLHRGGPLVGLVWITVRHYGPGFTRFERHQRLFQLARRRADQRAHARLQLPGGADTDAFNCVAQHALEFRVIEDLSFEQEQRRRRTFFSSWAYT